MHLKAAIAGLVLIGGASVASAQAIDPMRACSGIGNSKARLDCYDALARSHAAAEAPPGVTGPSAEPTFNTGGKHGGRTAHGPQGAPVASGDTFGLDTVHRKASEQAARPNQVMTHVVAARDDGFGHWIFTLDTGAVWQMTEKVPGFIPPRKGTPARVRRGSIGSYFLDVGHQAGVRIQRLR